MKRASVEFSVGIFVLIGIICVGYLTIQLGDLTLFQKDYYPLTARFASIGGLKTGAPVEMAGVQIGRVNDIRLDPQDKVAVVDMEIRKEFTLYDDVIASVKTSGLIGDKFIKLSPGGAGFELEPGDRIIETESAIDLEELISKYVFGEV
jgi:phospholipid/cholesterol/gamma-HCH transport system substrate-binding protein